MKRVHRVEIAFLSLFTLGLVGCNSTTNISSANNSSTIDDIDGGEHSRVVGMYTFDTFKEYQNFYVVFKQYNSERYLAPIDSFKNINDIKIRYVFKSEGMLLDDVNEKRYDLNFDYQTMTIKMYDNDIALELNLVDISNYNFNEETISLYFNFSDLSQVTHKTHITLLSDNQNVIGTGSLVFSEDLTIDNIETKLDFIINLFKGGYSFVF